MLKPPVALLLRRIPSGGERREAIAMAVEEARDFSPRPEDMGATSKASKAGISVRSSEGLVTAVA